MNHMPWDNGACDEALKAVLGIGTTFKTTKTRCGKRVKIQDADYNQPITCVDCAASIEEERQFIAEQKKILGL